MYKIPKNIKNNIPEYFYPAMAGELFAVAGINKGLSMFSDDKYLNTSTSGWTEAFNETCRKLKMQWLLNYRETLEWDESDLFDAELEKRILNKGNTDAYYTYLVYKHSVSNSKQNQ